MAIVDTINSMYENVGEVYDTITNVDLPTNKNIENIPKVIRKSYLDIMNNGIDTIYDNWEKVNGTGTSISLNNTEEAPMTIEYKGNTSQATTTGKNLFIPTLKVDDTNISTIRCSVSLNNDEYTFSATGSDCYFGNIVGTGNAYNKVLGTLYDVSGITNLVFKPTNSAFDKNYVCYYDNNKVSLGYVQINNNTGLITPVANTKYIGFRIGINNSVSGTNYTTKMQLEKGSTATEYEPYTNGASPNPDYSQDIHVVSGDNYINVVGKNLLKYPYMNTTSTVSGVTFTDNGNGSITINGTSTSSTYSLWFFYENAWSYNGLSFELEPGTYTFKALGTDKVSMPVNIYFSDNTHEYFAIYNNDVTKTITEKVRLNMRLLVTGGVSVNNVTIYPQIEKGSTATEYEEYQSGSYEINLGKNLLDLQTSIIKSLNTSGTWNENVYTNNGLTITINDDKTIKINGTATAQETFLLENQQMKYPTGTYYLSGAINGGNNSYDIRMFNYDGTSVVAQCYTGVKEINVINNKQVYNVAIVVRSGQTLNNVVFYPMFSTSNDTNYSPYFTPIELCKIGDYQDRIFKSSGKNLFDNTYNDLGMWITNIGETTTFAQGSQYLGAYCKVEPGTYTISRNKKTNRFRIGVSPNQPTGTTSSCYVVASNDNASSITIDVPQGNNYICIYLSNNSETSTNVDLMINKGTTATTYEPYGKDWYLHKETGKITFDGSENWGRSGNTSESFFCGALAGVNIPFKAKMGTAVDSKCNYFAKGNSHSNAEVFDMYNGTDYYTAFALYLSTSKVTDVTTFKNWLASNNTTLYYVLYQPTYEKITGELLNQLEAIKKSYENQTNINQENNDLPFELEVGALEKY